MYWRIRMLKSEDIRMNWKIYEWIGVQNFFWKIYKWIGRYTNELEDSGCWNLEDIRMNWKIYAWIGVQIFFGIIHIYFVFSIGGLGFWNLKIYEWIGRYTNELGFRFCFGRYTNELEDIRMNWKIYEWIGVQIFCRNIYEWNWGLSWRKLWKFNDINEIN